MAVVFLSYTHTDKEFADRVENALKMAGHSVWRDINRTGGGLIPTAITEGIEHCEYMLILVTANSLNSEWMLREIATFITAQPQSDKMIPLRLDETEPKEVQALLEQLEYIDCRQLERGLELLLHTLGTPEQSDIVSSDDRERLHFAIDLALRAGNVAMRFYNSSIMGNTNLDVRKNAATSADRAAQIEIESAVINHPLFRDDVFVAEEAPHNNTQPSDSGYTWVVDPLDGTTNFQNRIPLFCTAIGLLKEGRPHIGVIYAPVSHELYYAVDGSQAKLWDISRGDVSLLSADQSAEGLSDCIVGTHISSRPDMAKRLLGDDALLDVAAQVKHVRALGCGQLALAYVASGRLHAFYQFGSYVWDQVAGIVLVANSHGGLATELPGGAEWTHSTEDFVASANADVHQQLLKVLSVHDK